MDLLGRILWIVMFLTPLLTIPLTWKLVPGKKWLRILLGLFLAPVLSFILYLLVIAIVFRDGMGP